MRDVVITSCQQCSRDCPLSLHPLPFAAYLTTHPACIHPSRTFCEPTRQCKCYTATMEDDYTDYEIVVDCSNMGLNDIPLGLPPDVHSLLLQGNNFTRLSLRSIVRALGTDLVNGTHDYPTTEATGPLMRLVGGEESGGFPSLRRLYLHNNPSLTVIDDDAFLATQRIRELLLHHTGLSELRRKSLLGLQNSLHTLWAQNSMITYIQPTTFLNFSKLTRMWLYNNPNTAEVNPKDLQGSMFRGLDSIRELVIDRVHKYKHGKISTKNFTCCNLVGLEEKMEARVYVGIDTKEKTISEGVVYKKPLFCGDCNSDSAAEVSVRVCECARAWVWVATLCSAMYDHHQTQHVANYLRPQPPTFCSPQRRTASAGTISTDAISLIRTSMTLAMHTFTRTKKVTSTSCLTTAPLAKPLACGAPCCFFSRAWRARRAPGTCNPVVRVLGHGHLAACLGHLVCYVEAHVRISPLPEFANAQARHCTLRGL